MSVREVTINHEPVELYKILKFEGLADNGGAAKALVEQGRVSVNGEVETRKRRQIVAGDLIGFGDETLRIVRADTTVAEGLDAEPGKAPIRKKRARLRPS